MYLRSDGPAFPAPEASSEQQPSEQRPPDVQVIGQARYSVDPRLQRTIFGRFRQPSLNKACRHDSTGDAFLSS